MSDTADNTIVFSTTAIKASTPNAPRRMRRSSGPGAPVVLGKPPTPVARSNSFNTGTLSQSRSIGRKHANNSTIANTRAARNQERPYEDLNLEPSAVFKALSRLKSAGQMPGVKVRDLVDNPKSCRNLMQQFEAAPREQPKFNLNFASEQRDQSVLYASKDSKDCQHTIQRLIRHLRQSNREFLQKYQKICQSTYIEQRDALLNPQLVEEATNNLRQVRQAIKSLSTGPTAFKTIHLLREKKALEGISCPAEYHAQVVETIVNLDRTLYNEQKLAQTRAVSNNEKLNEVFTKKIQSMEMDLDRLSDIQQKGDGIQDDIQRLRTRLRMLEMQMEEETSN